MTTEETEEQDLNEQDELYEHFRFVVEKGQAPIRIDLYLFNHMANVSRNRLQHACADGNILVNGKEIKSSYKVKPHDTIQIVLPEPVREKELIPQNIPLNIIYEDDDVIGSDYRKDSKLEHIKIIDIFIF